MRARPKPPGFLAATGTLLVMAVVFAVAATPATANGTQDLDDPFLARAYVVQHRSLTDAADLAGGLLSPEGSLTIKPRLKTIVIEDYRSILDRVGALLESFDLPPRTVNVVLSLFMGSRSDKPGKGAVRGNLSNQVRGVIEAVGDFTQWTSYEPLGSRSVSSTEGDLVEAQITPEYRVVFKLQSVHERQRVAKFRRFTLQRVKVTDGVETIEDLYTAGMVVTMGKLTMVVAASSPDSKQALFLALQVRPR